MAAPDTPSVNVGEFLLYLEQKFRLLIGRDEESKDLAEWFKGLQTTALKQTETVQCLGMRDPIPFQKIYQPTRLIVRAIDEDDGNGEVYAWFDKTSRSIVQARSFDNRSIRIDEFLKRDQDAIIYSGPGWGKTTFLHHIFRSTVRDDNVLPVLITLRRPRAVEDLEKYVEVCSRIQKKQHRACTLLLVDGYDEIKREEQKRVSEALLQYQAHRAGKFYLTCREYYQVSLVAAPQVRIDAFSRDDQVRFVEVFLSSFDWQQDGEAVVSQLEGRGFSEFLSHPLLLTLACIVRTSSSSLQPRSGLRLLERALDVLCYQWDEKKQIDRKPSTALDGRDRLQVLRSIAYTAKSPFVRQQRAEETARKELNLLGHDKVDPREALMETARFYGILVPTDDGYEFVHRTIHDFLAAQRWVQSGKFATETQYEWNARTGYAASLVDDSTDVLEKALNAPNGLPTATEIISNAAFQMDRVCTALISYFSEDDQVLSYEKSEGRITGLFKTDFVRLANSRFLDFIVEQCCGTKSNVTDLLVAYSLSELYERRLKLAHQTYEKALASYKSEKFTFHIAGAKQVQLGFLNPILSRRLV